MPAPWHLNGKIHGRRSSGPVPYPSAVKGERVWCVVHADRDLGDTGPAAWVDSYIANKDGDCPPSFSKRIAGRLVWSRNRGKAFHFLDEAHAAREAALVCEE